MMLNHYYHHVLIPPQHAHFIKYCSHRLLLLTPHTPHSINGKFGERWVFLGGAIFVYLVRTLVYPRGWYIITYGLGIYLLNLFIAFLSPKFDPEFEFDEQDNYNSNISGRRSSESDSGSRSQQLPGGSLDDGEIRPFYRRLPEFQFWWAVTKGVVIALALTFTRATDIPVYWPILLIYFLFLFTFSMRKQISHMIRYRYVPWTLGKKRYAEASTTTTAAIGQFVNTTINNWVISTQPTGIPQHATVNPHIQQKKQQD